MYLHGTGSRCGQEGIGRKDSTFTSSSMPRGLLLLLPTSTAYLKAGL